MTSTRLFEVYELFKAHVPPDLHVRENARAMNTVNQEFGIKFLKSPSSYPHIVWVPTEDEYGPPRILSEPLIVSGQQVFVDAVRTRIAGCKLYIFHSDYVAMEDLINDVHIALYDVLLASGSTIDPRNFSIGNGHWDVDPAFVRDNTVCYVQNITVQIPVYRLFPATTILTKNIHLPQ